jgi:hypothetical protein
MTEQRKAKIENLDQQEEEQLTPAEAEAAGGMKIEYTEYQSSLHTLN